MRISAELRGAPNRAAVLRALLSRCWNGDSQVLLSRKLPQEECCSMRVHLDKKPSGGVAIAFFVITLLTPVALAILLSRLNSFFEADAVGVENACLGTLFGRRGA
jgi:hypothetical protein